MPRCGSDAAERNASAGTSFAGEFGKRDGADVFGYAGFECEQQRSVFDSLAHDEHDRDGDQLLEYGEQGGAVGSGADVSADDDASYV